MKKALILLTMLLIVGCGKNEEKVEISFSTSNYNIAKPYKQPITENFIIDNSLNNYDPLSVSNDLMMLSSNYFKINNSLYQDGQYLTEEIINDLLSFEKLNNLDDTIYFSSIVEQNFLATNGNLKGLSIALVLNPYLAIRKEDGTVTYKERIITEDFIVKSANKLVKNLRLIENLKSKKIVVGIFYLNEPSSLFSGTFKYIGSTFNEEIKLTKLAYNYQLLNDDFVSLNDMNNYKMFERITDELKSVDKGANISGTGLYFDNKPEKIDIEINGTFSKSQVIYLSEIISKEIITEGSVEVDISVVIKSNKEVAAIIYKSSDSLKTNIEILRG